MQMCKRNLQCEDWRLPVQAWMEGKDALVTSTGAATMSWIFQGPTCADECDDGTFGANCKKRCACKNGAKCDAATGKCLCPDGYSGEQCETPCPVGKYGAKCDKTCVCENGATCNVTSGKCICGKGFVGEKCENKRKSELHLQTLL